MAGTQSQPIPFPSRLLPACEPGRCRDFSRRQQNRVRQNRRRPRILAVATVTNPQMLGGVRVGEVKLRRPAWIDDDNLLLTFSTTSPPPFVFTGPTSEWFQIANFNISKHKLDPMSFEVGKMRTFNVITDDPTLREISGHMTLYSRGYCVRDRTVPCLFFRLSRSRPAVDCRSGRTGNHLVHGRSGKHRGAIQLLRHQTALGNQNPQGRPLDGGGIGKGSNRRTAGPGIQRRRKRHHRAIHDQRRSAMAAAQSRRQYLGCAARKGRFLLADNRGSQDGAHHRGRSLDWQQRICVFRQ